MISDKVKELAGALVNKVLPVRPERARMQIEEEIQRAVDQVRAQTWLDVADWLQHRTGTSGTPAAHAADIRDEADLRRRAKELLDAGGLVECPHCKRPEDAVNHVPGHIFVGWGRGWQPCVYCEGSQKIRMPLEKLPERARLDLEGTAQGKTRLVDRMPEGAACGIVTATEYVNTETGVRTPLGVPRCDNGTIGCFGHGEKHACDAGASAPLKFPRAVKMALFSDGSVTVWKDGEHTSENTVSWLMYVPARVRDLT